MNKVVFFDGVCNLCNGTVQRLIELDKNNVLKFSSLQSESGQRILQENHMDTENLSSILYYKDGKVFKESDAIIEILYDLGGAWEWSIFLKFVPEFLRDNAYKLIAKNRYQWFGKQESCWLPTPELQKKFIN